MARQARWRLTEGYRESQKRFRHSERRVIYTRRYNHQYRLTHKAEIAEYERRWRVANPLIVTHHHRLRRVRIAQTVANLTIEQWLAIKMAYKEKCAYCGIKSKTLTQDHVTPLSKGGTHTPDNIVPACPTCNFRKHNKILQNPPVLRLGF